MLDHLPTETTYQQLCKKLENPDTSQKHPFQNKFAGVGH